MKQTNLTAPYSQDYKNKCFVVWYAAGRPERFSRDMFPKDEHGRTADISIIRRWRRDEGWLERADELDGRAMEQVNNSLIMQKAEMLKRQANIGKMMQEKGAAYLEGKEGIDDAHAAILAIARGVDIERTSRGLSEFLIKLSKMTDADIKEEIVRLSSRVDNRDVVDAEVKEETSEEASDLDQGTEVGTEVSSDDE